jgi:hypothetical protein
MNSAAPSTAANRQFVMIALRLVCEDAQFRGGVADGHRLARAIEGVSKGHVGRVNEAG